MEIDAQLLMHCSIYVSWIFAMAIMRTMPTDFIQFITESLVETISIDRGICKGNLYASLWYLTLIALYVRHLLLIYATFTHKKQIIPDVKKFQSLPPRFIK